MKLLPWVLVGSLAANAAFVGILVRAGVIFNAADEVRDRSEKSNASLAAAKLASEKAAADNAGNVLLSKLSESAKAMSVDASKQLSATDLKAFAEHLRTAGFSANAIRAIISGLIQDRMIGQYRELQKELLGGQKKYWSNKQNPGMSKDYMVKSRAINEERIQLMKAALGEDAMKNDPMSAFQQNQYGNLSQEKSERLTRVLQDYNEMRNEIYSSTQGVMLPEDKLKLAFIENEQRADLQQLLSPDELFEYEVRSPSGSMLRSRMGAFEATEDEYRRLFKMLKDTDALPSGMGFGMGSDYQKLGNALTTAAKSVLSPERYADFELAANPQYSQVTRLLARLDMPLSAARGLVAIQTEGMKQANTVRSNRDLTPEQRTSQLQALSQTVTAQLKTALNGDRGFEAYKENGGNWLQIFTQPTQQPRPGGPVLAVPRPGK